MDSIHEIKSSLNDNFHLRCSDESSIDDLRNALANSIDYMIQHEFSKLIQLLYRLDIDENKLRSALNANEGRNAAVLIATMIIERQMMKIESRKKYSSGNQSDEEKW